MTQDDSHTLSYKLFKGKLSMVCYMPAERKRIRIMTDIEVSKSLLTKEGLLLSRYGTDYKQKNAYLTDSLKRAESFIARGFEVKQAMSMALSDTVDTDLTLKEKHEDLMAHFDEFIKHKSFSTSHRTLAHYKVMYNQVTNWLDNINMTMSKDVVTTAFIRDFASYLAETNNLKNTTIKVRIKHLKQFINWLNSDKDVDIQASKIDFTIGKQSSNVVISLNEHELKEFIETDYPSLQETKDCFVFGCLTGLRISDLRSINDSNIKSEVLVQTNRKTGITVKVPLTQQAMDIWFKFDGKLPLPADQVFNGNLKRIARKCPSLHQPVELVYYQLNEQKRVTKPKWELISAHTARRTFVTRALAKGLAPNDVMRMSGHRSLSTLMKYLDVNSGTTDENITNLLAI